MLHKKDGGGHQDDNDLEGLSYNLLLRRVCNKATILRRVHTSSEKYRIYFKSGNLKGYQKINLIRNEKEIGKL